MKKPWKTEVMQEGGNHYAHLTIGNQGFAIIPIYRDGKDDDARESAQWMADMLDKAITQMIDDVDSDALGTALVDAATSGMYRTECVCGCGATDGFLHVWSANANEQLGEIAKRFMKGEWEKD